MKERFTKEIENLRTNLIRMASLVDDQVENAMKSLETGDGELCRSIKAKDMEIDAYDNLIMTQCENYLALFQPVATDLRFVMSALMINNQLERCGDIAVNIAQRVKKTLDSRELIAETQVPEMGKKARDMIKKAIDSVMNNDIELAKTVLAEDKLVDKMNKAIFKSLIAKMQSDPNSIEACAHLIVLTRNIERLADHATNIAEDIVFYVDAKVISHGKKLHLLGDEEA